MLSFECIKNEKSVYFLLTSAELKNWCRFGENLRILVKFLAICPVLPTFKNPDLTSKNPVFMRVCGLSAHFPTFNTKLL